MQSFQPVADQDPFGGQLEEAKEYLSGILDFFEIKSSIACQELADSSYLFTVSDSRTSELLLKYHQDNLPALEKLLKAKLELLCPGIEIRLKIN